MEKRDLTVDVIYDVVAEYYGLLVKISIVDRYSKMYVPYKRAVYYRAMMTFVSRSLGISAKKIGSFFGQYNNTSVTEYTRTMRELIKNDKQVRREFEELMQLCEEILNF